MQSLADALKDMQKQSLLTRDVAEKLYAYGIETMQRCLDQPGAVGSTVRMEAVGRIAGFRGHRSNWVVWANVPMIHARITKSDQQSLVKISLRPALRLILRKVPAQATGNKKE
ncbi:hypothetical protein GNI_102180 [Gregarina niphandrodes]|uniref:Uncharacterized protein n=1 Tax=Gregarina niphandrodes TaxID=110365 RepID=A0A023B4D5_GRENI|nr:hypothetical protein GNI_102180 [Gregarina niphandrodes]EZG56678.1 hypothetical protein GNI_102180 [Gregarina niphandrodes]|eukprot:XP_011131208.1 hypothetical protein GNI_102180 [Gregarina niphandrodes]